MDRTKDDIDKLLNLAKIDRNDLQPGTHVIHFSDDIVTSNNYRLMQLTPDLLNELQKGTTLIINGDPDDNVTLCSNDRTYETVLTETSNSLLLVDNLAQQADVAFVPVHTIFKDYLELVERKPNLQKIIEYVKYAVYKGNEHEHEINENNLHTFDELWNKIQASRGELQEILNDMQVIKINGKLRSLDLEYHFRVVSYMLKLIEENSWNHDEIDYDETMNSLVDLIPREVINSLFDLYTTESKTLDGVQLYKYKEKEVCQLFAQVLLFSAGKFNLNEFLQAWQESVPEGMSTDEEMLHGIALIDRKCIPNVIFNFTEDKLPSDLMERFKVLFEVKDKWSMPEIAPYLKHFTTSKMDVNAILAKHARASHLDGVKCYSSKHK